MRVTKAGMLAAAGFLVMFTAGIIEAVLDGIGAMPGLGLLLYVMAICGGVGLLFASLSIKARTEAAEDAEGSTRTPQPWDGNIPEPCQLCYSEAARAQCGVHKLSMCLSCCANHDPNFKCTMYLIPRYADAMKARG